jgi:hypothetical protein
MPEAAPCVVLPLDESGPLYDRKRAVLRRTGAELELRVGAGEAVDAALHRWLEVARVCSLDADELYFLEDNDSLQVQVSPRNEAAALALLLEVLRGAGASPTPMLALRRPCAHAARVRASRCSSRRSARCGEGALRRASVLRRSRRLRRPGCRRRRRGLGG